MEEVSHETLVFETACYLQKTARERTARISPGSKVSTADGLVYVVCAALAAGSQASAQPRKGSQELLTTVEHGRGQNSSGRHSRMSMN